MEAAMKSAEASNSFSPFTLLKRLLARIHISKGMLKMRISVMELGRFTRRGGFGRQPGSSFDYPPRQQGTQWTNHFGRDVAGTALPEAASIVVPAETLPATSLRDTIISGKTAYFGAGAVLSALGCLAMIASLILS